MLIKHICDVLLTLPPPQVEKRGTVMRFMNSELRSQDMIPTCSPKSQTLTIELNFSDYSGKGSLVTV